MQTYENFQTKENSSSIYSFEACLDIAKQHTNPLVFNAIITSKDAQKILAGNTANRPLSITAVKKLEQIIKNGEWLFNGDTIRIAKDLTLIDGQHRLQAVLNTNISINTSILLNANKNIFKTIDVGKKRTISDMIYVDFNKPKYSYIIGSSVKSYLNYVNVINNNAIVSSDFSSSIRMGIHQNAVIENGSPVEYNFIASFLRENAYFIEFVGNCYKIHNQNPAIIDISIFIALRWYCEKKFGEAISDKFWIPVIRGEYRADNSGISHLVRYLQKTKANGHERLITNPTRHFSTIAYCWNLFREDKNVSFLRIFNELIRFK